MGVLSSVEFMRILRLMDLGMPISPTVQDKYRNTKSSRISISLQLISYYLTLLNTISHLGLTVKLHGHCINLSLD